MKAVVGSSAFAAVLFLAPVASAWQCEYLVHTVVHGAKREVEACVCPSQRHVTEQTAWQSLPQHGPHPVSCCSRRCTPSARCTTSLSVKARRKRTSLDGPPSRTPHPLQHSGGSSLMPSLTGHMQICLAALSKRQRHRQRWAIIYYYYRSGISIRRTLRSTADPTPPLMARWPSSGSAQRDCSMCLHRCTVCAGASLSAPSSHCKLNHALCLSNHSSCHVPIPVLPADLSCSHRQEGDVLR
jgi:hypothetical protein